MFKNKITKIKTKTKIKYQCFVKCCFYYIYSLFFFFFYILYKKKINKKYVFFIKTFKRACFSFHKSLLFFNPTVIAQY